MKKIIITSVLIAGTIFANAQSEGRGQKQEQEQKQQPRANMMRRTVPAQVVASTTRAMPPQGEGRPEIMPPVIKTGDDVTDAKIKALTVEMETKIKAIRDEYQVKLKEVIGNRKIISTIPSAPEMPVYKEVSDRENGSSTEGKAPQPAPRRLLGQVEGVSTEGVGQAVSQDVGSRMRNFFGGLFGR
ncbi:MAG: hypothetical protein WCK60_00810 [Candidatus Nomurabacteria bacterium]